MQLEYPIDGYDDTCAVCGTFQRFEREARAIRETYRCKKCRALLRDREQARAILHIYGSGGESSISELVKNSEFILNRVYEPGTAGVFRHYFKQIPFYFQSDFYDNPEEAGKNPRIPHQSLEGLTYSDASFDLVITSDILEHVRRPQNAFAELSRVLRHGGYHIFTVPMQDPIPSITTSRVNVDQEIDVPILPERYHGNGKGGCSLVYNDFGIDIERMLLNEGFSTFFFRPKTPSSIVNGIVTLISKKVR